MKHMKKVLCSVTAVIGLVVGGVMPSTDLVPDAISVGMVQIGDVMVGELLVSPNALNVIGNAEGCMKTPYTCPAGLATDGIGNTKNVTGEIKSTEQIAIDWTRNIIAAQNCLAASTDVSLMSQGQVDAFTSFIFNTGCTRFRHNRDGSETRIYNKIKRHQFTAACNELRFWVYAGGKKLPGLINRRETETLLCHM